MDKRASVANTLAELDVLAPAGFAIALHIDYTTPKLLFQTYPQKWVEEYTSRGLVLHDPTVRWGFDNSGQIRWRELADEDSYGILKLAARFGMLHGATVVTHAQKSRTIASFTRSDREYLDAEIDTISGHLDDLHALTYGRSELSRADLDALKTMSIRLTHA